jgi:hypothetical protein
MFDTTPVSAERTPPDEAPEDDPLGAPPLGIDRTRNLADEIPEEEEGADQRRRACGNAEVLLMPPAAAKVIHLIEIGQAERDEDDRCDAPPACSRQHRQLSLPSTTNLRLRTVNPRCWTETLSS